MVKVLFVCLGNICRSPLAEGVFHFLLVQNGLDRKVGVDSCGTSAYHIGELADKRSRDVAFSHGIRLTSKARQLSMDDVDTFDYIIAMDSSNYKSILGLFGQSIKSKVFLMRDFDEVSGTTKDVPDPYYGGLDGFENVYQIIYRSCELLLNKIKNENRF